MPGMDALPQMPASTAPSEATPNLRERRSVGRAPRRGCGASATFAMQSAMSAAGARLGWHRRRVRSEPQPLSTRGDRDVL